MKFARIIQQFYKSEPTLAARPLHCVFYAHAWSVFCLQEQGLLNPQTDVVVELATTSHLGRVLDPDKNRPGCLTGLLQPHRHLHQLATRYPDLPAPALLAPSENVPVSTVISALALVGTDLSPIKRALVLVNLCDATSFAAAYAFMADFCILWDCADYPDARLPEAAKVLADEQCLDRQRWRGFRLCNHPARPIPDKQARETEVRGLLQGFGNLDADR